MTGRACSWGALHQVAITATCYPFPILTLLRSVEHQSSIPFLRFAPIAASALCGFGIGDPFTENFKLKDRRKLDGYAYSAQNRIGG